MTGHHATAPLIDGVDLLERAINYSLGSLRLVTPEAMTRPTPCREWDLHALLEHMNDSLLALHEAVNIGHIDLNMSTEDTGPAVDLVASLRDRACTLLGAWTTTDVVEMISIAGCPLTTSVVTSTGAIEIAVHGWDVAEACGHHRPIPPSLAAEMLPLTPLFVTDADRPARFAAPVDVPRGASPGDELIAFLGRHP